ncbi:MAG: type II secretion system F family protein, partial [Nocardioidaceae bacterium]
QAFSALRDRCGSEPMDTFVSAFLQAEELGSPLAETLSTISGDTRREANQAARRKAARTVPRVTLVVSVVLVPPTLLLIAVGLYLGSDIDIGSLLGG